TAHAQQLVAELFETTLHALAVLDTEPELAAQLRTKLETLDRGLAFETYDGKWGNPHNTIAQGDTILREWKTSPYSVGQPGHRHLSHLMCLFPFSQVKPGTAEHRAAVNSLRMRGDASTGWSLGWKINLWARALDGNHARHMMKYSLNHSGSYGVDQRYGGVYYNLLDSHAPFQIDGNLGFTSGVAEMLLQSHEGFLRLLPAIPDAWATGSAYGMKAIGNFEVDQKWRDGRLTDVSVLSLAGQPCEIHYPGISDATVTDCNGEKIRIHIIDSNHISFPTEIGSRYSVSL
ncbi:MAG: glycoside hydrolase family 95 protein, partial [Muribaculaceae bacterium]|nr:glycoside hydrolase family 95 protein [Muribaculaceae bacterium]